MPTPHVTQLSQQLYDLSNETTWEDLTGDWERLINFFTRAVYGAVYPDHGGPFQQDDIRWIAQRNCQDKPNFTPPQVKFFNTLREAKDWVIEHAIQELGGPTAWPDALTSPNGMEVLARTKDAVYLRLPRGLWGKRGGKCTCGQCDGSGYFDTLVVPTNAPGPKTRQKPDYAYTVHMPNKAVREFIEYCKAHGR